MEDGPGIKKKEYDLLSVITKAEKELLEQAAQRRRNLLCPATISIKTDAKSALVLIRQTIAYMLIMRGPALRIVREENRPQGLIKQQLENEEVLDLLIRHCDQLYVHSMRQDEYIRHTIEFMKCHFGQYNFPEMELGIVVNFTSYCAKYFEMVQQCAKELKGKDINGLFLEAGEIPF